VRARGFSREWPSSREDEQAPTIARANTNVLDARRPRRTSRVRLRAPRSVRARLARLSRRLIVVGP
jgi:hypothetical protein